MYGVHIATIWASVSGMAGPLLAQVTASGEAVALFSAVVVSLVSAIGVLWKHITTLVKEQEQTIRTLNTNHEKTVHRLHEEGKEDRKEYVLEMRTCWTMLAEIEEKRQQAEQRLGDVLSHLERKLP